MRALENGAFLMSEGGRNRNMNIRSTKNTFSNFITIFARYVLDYVHKDLLRMIHMSKQNMVLIYLCRQ